MLVDPKCVGEKNLNRILNSTWRDAVEGQAKVEVLRRAIESMGLGTKVIPFAESLSSPRAVRELAGCDVLFGCMDGVEGRQLLNRLATFYSIPYFDVGVRLVADGQGGVSHICGSVNYLQPDGSSLMSRGLFTDEQVRAEAMRRESPEQFERLRGEGYIAGVDEERPAVLPVNMLFASLAVNEFSGPCPRLPSRAKREVCSANVIARASSVLYARRWRTVSRACQTRWPRGCRAVA